jgi:hypothetical protein
LANHLRNVIRTELRKNKIHMQRRRIRAGLSAQSRISIAASAQDGRRISIRKTSQAEVLYAVIYDTLGLPHRPDKTKRYEN